MSRVVADTPLGRLCQAIGHPTRIRILQLLSGEAHTVKEIVRRLDLEQPAVSKHLATLLKAGLVRYDVDGRCRCYALANKDTVARFVSCFDNICQEHDNQKAG